MPVMEPWHSTIHTTLRCPFPAHGFQCFRLPSFYLRFTIRGREGYISNSPTEPEIDKRSAVTQPSIHYYIAGSESYFDIQGPLLPLMLDPLWLDATMMDDRTSSAASTARQDIIDPDGSCVMTGAGRENCQAYHIIPHSRGDRVCFSEHLLNHFNLKFLS